MDIKEKNAGLICRLFNILLGIAGGLLVFVGIVHILDYIYVNADDSEIQRVILHDFYQEKGQIDNLYLGSSHVFCDLNTIKLSEMNSQFNFNLATPSQLPNGTFYLLKEADRYNTLSHVYVELYYAYNVKLLSGEEPMYAYPRYTWQNADNMPFSINKFAYMFSAAEPEQYTAFCIPFTRYRISLDNWDYIKQVIDKKQQEKYLNFELEHEDGNGIMRYVKNGYFFSSRVLGDCDKIYRQTDILSETSMAEQTEKYLRKTIEYCQMRDIPITLFISPIYELQLISTENYDNYIDEVRAIAEEYNVEFYDFNLAREEYFPIQHKEYFKDVHHLNSAGADMYTSFFYEVVSGDESDYDKYFYDSYAEKLQNAAPEIYGIYYRNSDNTVEGEEQMRTYWVASNRNSGMEYRIIITPNEGEQYMIQDFNENKEFVIPASETGICSIVARMKETPDNVQTLEINF